MILALCVAFVQAVVPLVGVFTNDRRWMNFARPMAWAQFLFMLIAFLLLMYAFVVDDFSVRYVASNSNSALPWYYKISAVWGAHEGSLLLWALILSGWTFAVSIFSKQLPIDVLARVLSVMGMISVGFLLFLIITSNPFIRFLPNVPIDGRDLNPLLQDIGLIIHPPILYMGYVGFSVAFAFAIAALWSGRLDAAWARWSRPWTLTAWSFLGLGIALGSWWAYYELGWGGWWSWDPVENASLMPWLIGTALVHSLAATEKRGVFKSWTVLLAIAAFSLSLLGTFLVRSGVLTSVHAFASDPARGLFILVFLLVVVGGSLTLFAARAGVVSNKVNFGFWSRETFLLINNIILVVAGSMVLLGTLYPLVIDALNGDKISVGPPYFNAMFTPLMALLMLMMAVGMIVRWKTTSISWLARLLIPIALISLILSTIVAFIMHSFHWASVAVCCLSFWIILVGLRDIANKIRHASSWHVGLRKLSKSYWGMQLAHLGIAVCAIGIVFTTIGNVQRDLRMSPNDSLDLDGYHFVFKGTTHYEGANFSADRGVIEVFKDKQHLVTLHPEKRLYSVQQAVMTEAGIDANITRDLFVALGEPLNNETWAVRIQIKPFVRWIWCGVLLMSLGGILCLLDKRYRIKQKRKVYENLTAGENI
ncbi:UNVERIFIED_CONTAM: hypothetical protein GTU68_036251 [Idotea baltica]|nr:hypothetical protein [Idotea baltica]